MFRFRTFRVAALAGALSLALTPAAFAADTVTGGGSTFIQPVLTQWAQDYQKATGTEVNYQGIGSGGGLRGLGQKTLTFAASDKPLKEDELKEKGYVQWPMIAGAIVPVVNLDGIKPGELTLDGDTMAKIFMGKIKQWDDAEIAKLNPDVKLPSKAITVVHRSDGSGTTFNFTNYLNKVSPDWKSEVGSSTEVKWPTGIGGKGNQGVAQYVQQVPASIGYVEYAYALENKMTYTKLVNKNGKAVEPSSDTFKAAAEGADYASAPGFYLILTDQPGDNAWPIMATTFVLMYAEPQDAAKSLVALKFLDWSFKNGVAAAEKLDYLPIPEKVYTLIEKTWSEQFKGDLWPPKG